ncbi:MAG: 16S rRNA (guanine(527)-N(7))-methyltransferase RsmG [Brachymonas denitrificans]|jgi:16S rRNA (guanine527-N7)-methyltransferase|uniref:16S rRNA (guanine(527)-N(7))-methyltransferase RsmG n=1 Tax=Brachymonas denitrificans TaxID=28220 RepID=UPI001BCA7C09|nr:16S rRNA (guanine(527)-N(7))-methyltransferase RsmG [Brachymonas denitrificans]
MRALQAELEKGLKQLQLELTDAQLGQLLDYLELLQKWNRVYNLTAVRDPQEMLTHHLLDSLAAVRPLQRHVEQNGARTLLDVGSGGGLPGVVFAICCPELQVSCVDTVGKKAAFIQQAAAGLRLTNLRGIHARVEKLTDTYDVVSSRAFATLKDFTDWSEQALTNDGVWLAMKGKEPVVEMAQLSAGVEVFHVEQLTVPMLDAQRCIVWIRKSMG